MLSLQADRLKMLSVPVSTGWLLGECMEARGKQELWTRQRPEVLAALREQAVIQSAESSNRIEGVTVAGDRLRPLTDRKFDFAATPGAGGRLCRGAGGLHSRASRGFCWKSGEIWGHHIGKSGNLGTPYRLFAGNLGTPYRLFGRWHVSQDPSPAMLCSQPRKHVPKDDSTACSVCDAVV